jgi:hypothetical protein
MKLNHIAALATALLLPLAAHAQTSGTDSAPSAKSSFEAFAASFSPSGDAALHLLQTFLNCPDSPVAQSIDSTLVSTVVLYETMGKFKPTAAESRTLSKDDFRQRVVAGIAQIQGVDDTDVASAVDCALPHSQVDAWTAKLDLNGDGFIQFKKRLATFHSNSPERKQ